MLKGKEEYNRRIAVARPVQLVIITHELLLEFLEIGIEGFEEGDMEKFYFGVNKAKSALAELMDGIDHDNEIGKGLYELYLYAGERLNKAYFAKLKEVAEEIKEMFEVLLEGWRGIEDTPDNRAMGPQVVAGLTYGRGGELSEYVEGDEGGGFRA